MANQKDEVIFSLFSISKNSILTAQLVLRRTKKSFLSQFSEIRGRGSRVPNHPQMCLFGLKIVFFWRKVNYPVPSHFKFLGRDGSGTSKKFRTSRIPGSRQGLSKTNKKAPQCVNFLFLVLPSANVSILINQSDDEYNHHNNHTHCYNPDHSTCEPMYPSSATDNFWTTGLTCK